MTLRVNNSPTAIFARDGIADASSALANVSKKFATGQRLAKPSEDLFSSIEAAMGESTMVYTKSALSNLTRLRAILSTRTGALETMRSGAQELANISLQASGALPKDVRTANINVFAQLMDRVSNIADTADYGGIKLLNGTFGSAGEFSIRTPATFNAAPFKTANLATLVNTDATAANAQKTAKLTITAPADGATFTIGPAATGLTITLKDGIADESSNEVAKGATNEDTAKNIIDFLNRSDDENVLKYGYSRDGAVITLTRLAISADAMDNAEFDSSDNGGTLEVEYGQAQDTVASTDRATGVSILGQVGEISTLSQSQSANHRGTWSTLYQAATGTALSSDNWNTIDGGANEGTGAAQDADLMTKFKFDIGGETFHAYHLRVADNAANGGNYKDATEIDGMSATVDSKLLVIKASDDIADAGLVQLDSKVFEIDLQAALKTGTGDGDAKEVNASNRDNFISLFNIDAANLSFKQDRYMTVNTSGGDILHNKTAIGSVAGMTARLISSDYTNNQVQNVTADSSGITVRMKTSTGDYKDFVTGAFQASYAAGSQIILTHAASGDAMVITLGGTHDLDLSTEAKRDLVSSAFKNALGSTEASTFIVGTDVSQTLTLSLNDMSWSTLTDGTSLAIDTQANAQTATTLLNSIVEVLNREIGLTAAYDKAVDSLVQQMEVSQQNLSAAVEELTAIDIAETREQLDNALQVMQAAIGAIMADNRAKQTLNRLLEV